jgi:hypothetical protein
MRFHIVKYYQTGPVLSLHVRTSIDSHASVISRAQSSQLRLFQFSASRGILVRMCYTLPPTDSFSLLDAITGMRELENACTRNVEMPRLHGIHNLRQILHSETAGRVRGEKGGLQVVGREMSVRTPVRVGSSWLVCQKNLLTAAKGYFRETRARSRENKNQTF